ACNLGNRVSIVGRLQGTCQQIFFSHRLWSVSRVDAGRAQKQQLAHSVAPCRMDHVVLDEQILQKEIDRIVAVRKNSADLCRGEKDILRLDSREERLDCPAIREIELGSRTS